MRGCKTTFSYHNYVKGIYNKHPPLTKYVNICGMNKLLIYYGNMVPNSELTIKQLWRKMPVLFMLLGARRKQVYVVLQMWLSKLIKPFSLQIKHWNTNPKHPLESFIHHSFSENENICSVSCWKFYIGEQNKWTDESQGRLMITYGKPHTEASSETLPRRIKVELLNVEIDVNIFQAHSCIAVSKARQQTMKILEILKRGCWSMENSFTKFYNKGIIKSNCNDLDYSSVVLSMWNCFQGFEFWIYREVLQIKSVRCE